MKPSLSLRRRARMLLSLSFVAVAVAACGPLAPQRQATVDRMYVLYCGEAHIPDISPWSPGVDVGKPFDFSDNCYLIRHGDDWMIWDTGFADALVDAPDGVAGARGMRARRTRTLASQLAEIDVSPTQVRYMVFSHTHGDHVGNSRLFPTATVYMQEPEYDAAFGPEPERYGFVPSTYETLRANPIVKLHGDFDVFGDGSVRILSTPGHTPGHQSLLVRLPKSGAVVLSGDAAHFTENFVARRAPGFNFDVDQTRRSMDRLATIVEAEHARLWINHDRAQSLTIAHAPAFVE